VVSSSIANLPIVKSYFSFSSLPASVLLGVQYVFEVPYLMQLFLVIRTLHFLYMILLYRDNQHEAVFICDTVNNGLLNMIGAQATILFQVADPSIAKGLMNHSTMLINRPIRRLVHTIEFLGTVCSSKRSDPQVQQQLDSVLYFFKDIHKPLQVADGYTREGRQWVWSTIIVSHLFQVLTSVHHITSEKSFFVPS
jgi:hypothetical protein